MMSRDPSVPRRIPSYVSSIPELAHHVARLIRREPLIIQIRLAHLAHIPNQMRRKSILRIQPPLRIQRLQLRQIIPMRRNKRLLIRRNVLLQRNRLILRRILKVPQRRLDLLQRNMQSLRNQRQIRIQLFCCSRTKKQVTDG